MLTDWLLATWSVISQSAPWLLVGFFLAGLLHVLLPADFITRHLQKPGFLSVLKASIFGLPLPLCSCSVIPVATTLRRKGASRGATAAFFVSTPEIGVDSYLLSYSLLGPWIALARVVASFVSAMTVGVAINLFGGPEEATTKSDPPPACCAHEAGHKHDHAKAARQNKLLSALKFGFVDLVDDLTVLLLIGFLAAGAITVLVPDNFFADLSTSGSMFLMLFVSLPLYICAASSTPLAVALLAKGLAPGAAVVFLLAGPASNITTVAAIGRELGRRALVFYLLGVALVSLLAGWLLNEMSLSGLQLFNPHSGTHHTHEHAPFWAGLILLWLMAVSLFRKLKK